MAPRWTFENKITLGNMLTIGATAVGLMAGYMTLANTVANSADAVKAIPGIESRVTTIETRINIGQQAREAFQARTEDTLDKLSAQNAQILAQLAAIVARMDEAERAASRTKP